MLDEIVRETSLISGSVSEIADVSDGQKTMLSEISAKLGEVEAIIEKTDSAAHNSAAASEELSGQANVMKSLLNQFRISEDAGYKGETYTPEKRREMQDDSSKY